MKTKKIIYSLLFLISQYSFGQIIFDKATTNTSFNKNIQQADSAIRAGEFGEVHSFLLIKSGKLIFESYYNGGAADSAHQLQSATKSIVATLFGCALQQNIIKDVHEKVAAFYPKEYTSGKENIKFADLLTQQHGLKWKESPWEAPDNTWRNIYTSEGNWFRQILAVPMDTIPGTVFNYSNAAPVLVSGAIQNASKMNIDVFAKKYLFDPLEIKNYRFWNGNGGAQNNGMALLFLKSRDMAKIGQLYLQKGKWNNEQIIPENFVTEATSAKVKNVEPNGFYTGYNYGYFWWSDPMYRNASENKKSKIFLARGAGGQNIIVWPEEEMVIVITAWNIQQSNKPQSLFDKYILK